MLRHLSSVNEKCFHKSVGVKVHQMMLPFSKKVKRVKEIMLFVTWNILTCDIYFPATSFPTVNMGTRELETVLMTLYGKGHACP